jgi:hypothetical protein
MIWTRDSIARLSWMIARQGEGYLDRTLSAAPFVAVMMTHFLMSSGSCSGSLPRAAPRDDGGDQGFRPLISEACMGTRQDGEFPAGKNYSIYGGDSVLHRFGIMPIVRCRTPTNSKSMRWGNLRGDPRFGTTLAGWAIMVDHNYRARLTTQTVQLVIASTAQLHGDHLVFVNSKGQLTALFLKELVRSWNMLPNMVHGDTGLRCCSGTEPIA